jgi:ABC-type Na+ efflux pump permease subunit
MRSIIAIALHDLRLTFSDRGALVWLFLLPVVFATFFGLVFGGSSSPTSVSASLAVVDRDRSELSRLLMEHLEGEGVEVEQLTPEQQQAAEQLPRTLVIPDGFETGVLAGEQQVLRLEKEPDASQEAALVAQARIVAAIARVLGRQVESRQQGAASVEGSATTSFRARGDLVTVDSRPAGRAKMVPNGFAQSIPGNAVMFVLLVALTYGAASISGERRSGQLRRLLTAPVKPGEIVAGKIAGRWVVSALQTTVMVLVAVVASRLFDLRVGDHPFQMWVILLLFAAVVAPLGVAVGGRFTDPDRAASIGVIATMVMAAFGGCWWPLEVVSKPLKAVALCFPTGWAMRALHGSISFGQGLVNLRLELTALTAFGLLFAALAWRSLRIE